MPDFSQLTDRQLEIYNFIKREIHTRGYPPTVRDIGEAFGIKSPNGVMCHLKALEKKGLIQRVGFSARAIQLVDANPAASGLPFVGRVAAGQPILAAEETDQQLSLTDLFDSRDHFLLQVKGQSMIEDHIEDGDYVVIRKKQTADLGERVVAMIDGEATLKRFAREKGQIRLDPANEEMEPIYVTPGSNIEILGTLAGVLRKC
jgi:repressor LexA